jgi:ADP-ribose pyrophosphatase YjhB (NUDIX family)
MTTVGKYGHTPFCPKPDDRRGRWGSVGPVDPTPSTNVPDEGAPTVKQLLRWSEALAGIARTGLGFTESLYEQERFEEVLHVAADIRAAIDGNDGAVDVDGVVHDWLDSVGKGVPGYVTPKVAVGAAVGNDKGEILLVQRADSGIWLYPTGWADIGYSAPEVVVKEVLEETGIEVEVVRLIAVLDGLRVGMSRIPLYSLVFQCRPVGGELKAHPLECTDVGWFPLDDLPFPLAGAERWGEHVFAALRGEPIEVLYDSVRSPVWRGDPDKV